MAKRKTTAGKPRSGALRRRKSATSAYQRGVGTTEEQQLRNEIREALLAGRKLRREIAARISKGTPPARRSPFYPSP